MRSILIHRKLLESRKPRGPRGAVRILAALKGRWVKRAGRDMRAQLSLRNPCRPKGRGWGQVKGLELDF